MVRKRLTILGANSRADPAQGDVPWELPRDTTRAKRLIELVAVPGWRNGRRRGLKIRCPQGRAGSTPAPGTTCVRVP